MNEPFFAEKTADTETSGNVVLADRVTENIEENPMPTETPSPRKKGHPVWRWVGRVFSVLGVTVLCVALFLLGVIWIMCKGPSETARNLFVASVRETSAIKWIPNIFFTENEVQHILSLSKVDDEGIKSEGVEFVPPDPDIPKDTIEIVQVEGPTFQGKMMIVHDPSRVTVGTLSSFRSDKPGKKIETFVKDTGAIAAINGGEFVDTGGTGNGGMPKGIVIHEGKLLYGGLNTTASVVAIDDQNRLLVGRMSGRELLEKNVRDAVSYGPALIVDGEALPVKGTGGGLNPRTCLGQRADGAMLLLVIEGRQPHSLGASYKDCIDVMLKFNAVNAGNLDGGSSSMMIYQGKKMTSGASMYGSRALPTVILVM